MALSEQMAEKYESLLKKSETDAGLTDDEIRWVRGYKEAHPVAGGGAGETKEALDRMAQGLDEQRRMLKKLYARQRAQYFEALDIWFPSRRSRDEQFDLKERSIAFYERAAAPGELYCMLLNRSYPRGAVICGHIWSYSRHGKYLHAFGLNPADGQDPRNTILHCKGLEDAFGEKEGCYLYDIVHNQIYWQTLCPALLDKFVFPSESIRFRDLHELEGGRHKYYLRHPDGHEPFKRLLAWHAYCSLKSARTKDWITEADLARLAAERRMSADALWPPDDGAL